MLLEFNHLIGIPYDKSIPPCFYNQDLLVKRTNCQRLIHLCYQSIGVFLPVGLWSQEIFYDNIFFRNVALETEPPEFMDIFCFGQEKTEPCQFHLSLHTGIRIGDDPIIIHASYPKGVKYDRLSDLLRQPKYSTIHAVKRLKPEYFNTHIQPYINNRYENR